MLVVKEPDSEKSTGFVKIQYDFLPAQLYRDRLAILAQCYDSFKGFMSKASNVVSYILSIVFFLLVMKELSELLNTLNLLVRFLRRREIPQFHPFP